MGGSSLGDAAPRRFFADSDPVLARTLSTPISVLAAAWATGLMTLRSLLRFLPPLPDLQDSWSSPPVFLVVPTSCSAAARISCWDTLSGLSFPAAPITVSSIECGLPDGGPLGTGGGESGVLLRSPCRRRAIVIWESVGILWNTILRVWAIFCFEQWRILLVYQGSESLVWCSQGDTTKECDTKAESSDPIEHVGRHKYG